MWKKAAALGAAAAFLLLSNLHPCCFVTVNGEPAGCCRPQSVLYALTAAEAALDELCTQQAQLPEVSLRFSLRLAPAQASAALLSDSVLSASPELEKAGVVYAGGHNVGCVENGEILYALIRESAGEDSAGAVFAEYADAIEILPQYTRAGSHMKYGDMLELLSWLSPAVYLGDAQQ